MSIRRRISALKRLLFILPVFLTLVLMLSSPEVSIQAEIGAPDLAQELTSSMSENSSLTNLDQTATPDAGVERAVTLNVDAITLIFPTPTRTPTPINIGNFVWDDRDHDGRQDVGENGLAGVTVQLWNASKTALIDSTVTNASGSYTLIAPIPGDYRVRVLLPAASDQFSPKDAIEDDLLDSDINPTGVNSGFTDIITLPSNVISTTKWDAGIIKFYTPTPTRTPTPINVGNFVWNDLDQDGVQDPGEPGLVGITVQLWNSAASNLITSTTTNANGNYTLVAPLPGDYRVRVLAPNGADFSPKDQGDNLYDSDFNPSGSSFFGFTDIITLPANLISITTIDAGLIHVPATNTPTKTPLVSSTPTPTPSFTMIPTLTPSVTPVGGIEMLSNGGFERKNVDDATKPELAPWAGKNLTKDKIKCSKPGKEIAFSGSCAFKFAGSPGENSKIKQTVELTAFAFNVGDTLNFSVQINGKSAATTGKIKVVIKYNDATDKGKIVVDMLSTDGYTAGGGVHMLGSSNLKKIKIVIQHRSPKGKVFIDAASLFKLPTFALIPVP